jgi:hypothetical protein
MKGENKVSKKSDLVVAGFIRLSESEQKEVANKIREYLESSIVKKSEMSESIIRGAFVLGPLGGGGCPCCGR